MQFLQINPPGKSRHRQTPEELIRLDPLWERSEVAFGDGKRKKLQFFCPSPAPFSFLISGHRYLFKYHEPASPWSFLSEVIASITGRFLGFPVPPVFLAFDKDGQTFGALCEWGYGYPANANLSFEHATPGGDLLEAVIPDFDRKRGEKHNIQDIVREFEKLSGVGDSWMYDWADLILFDALIGNSDRHQENWEILRWRDAEKNILSSLAPIYDNGTSFAQNAKEDAHLPPDLEKFWQDSMTHINLTRDDAHLTKSGKLKAVTHHSALIRYFIGRFPDCRKHMLQRLEIDLAPVLEQISELQAFPILPRLSEKRAAFIKRFLTHRQQKLISLLC